MKSWKIICLVALYGLTAAASDAAASDDNAIRPHRAIYTMSLASAKNGSNITGASGHMMFEWRDVCDGWAIQEHMQLHFTYAEGEDQDVVSNELTWESKDGHTYNFNIRHLTNGAETELFRGKALLKTDGSGMVTYTAPGIKHVKLPPGTLFPTTHTKLILQKAAAGEKLFSRRVFDGSDADGSSDISAFILPSVDVKEDVSLSPELKNNPMLAVPAWPVRMAFFKVDGETGEPDYEMNLDLLPSGIARHMKIDYGDFAVSGTLEQLEPLTKPHCP